MDEIVLKYDGVDVFEDRYAFKRLKRKPVLRVLYDCFFSRMSWSLLFIPLFILLLFLIKVPITTGMILGPLLVICFFVAGIYYERHRDVDIFKDKIIKSYLDKGKRTLTIEYADNKRRRVKVCDLPSEEADRSKVLTELKKEGILLSDV